MLAACRLCFRHVFLLSCLSQALPPGAAIRFICNVPGDTNGLFSFLASNGRTWSQPQSPCDDEHFQQSACAWEAEAVKAVSENIWPVSLQPVKGHSPLRVVTSNCPGVLQQGTKQSMLGIPHARVPTCTYPCLDPTSTVEDNTNWVMIDLGSHYRSSQLWSLVANVTKWFAQVRPNALLASAWQLHRIHEFMFVGVRGHHESARLDGPARALQ